MITRFAPSPTGPLHLGHASSALTVWKVARDLGGTALLRIEDTDSTRARPEYEAGIYTDLAWLGLQWPKPVRRQSAHKAEYNAALMQLAGKNLIFPCGCSRREIIAAGARQGADGMVYPGTCRHRPMADAKPGDGVRLDIGKALAQINDPLHYLEIATGAPDRVDVTKNALLHGIGDPILLRKDTGDPAYHLACVHDDALQKISHVVRGTDLRDLTPLHVVLQRLLGYPTPLYYHHALITDESGKRLAKIDKSRAIALFRAEGVTPADIRKMIGFVD